MTPVRVAVAEVLVAIQVYVLFTPTASDPLADHRLSVRGPSVFSWRSVGPVWALAGVTASSVADAAKAETTAMMLIRKEVLVFIPFSVAGLM